jgi:hypothetical protein
MKLDYDKLQNEFSLYKLENKDKTLQDFCNKKKINYYTVRKHLRVSETAKIQDLYKQEKAKAFTETIERQAEVCGVSQGINYNKRMQELETLIDISKKEFYKMQNYNSKIECVKAICLLVKTQIELEKVKLLNKDYASNNEGKETEDQFFMELFNAKIATPDAIQPLANNIV